MWRDAYRLPLVGKSPPMRDRRGQAAPVQPRCSPPAAALLKGRVRHQKSIARAIDEDDLTRWLKDNRDVLLLDEHVNETLVARVTGQGYAPGLSDEEIERVGRDPFLIAYALGDPGRRTVVRPRSRNRRKRAQTAIDPGRVR